MTASDLPGNVAEAKRLQRIHEYMKTFAGIKDLDLLVLKSHVLIDYELRRLLSFRLALSDDESSALTDQTKNLPFFQLANIALAGNAHRDLRTQVLRLNDARTEIAHRMDPEAYRTKLQDFTSSVWGKGHPAPTRDVHVETIVALAAVWGQIVRIHVDGRYGEGTFERNMP